MFYYKYVNLCNKRNISPSAAAEEMGFHRSDVTRWSKGSQPRQATIQKVADYFGVSVSALLSEEKAYTHKSERSDAVKIPVLGTVPAGIPIEAIEDIMDWEEIPASMCHGEKEYFALQIKGDSMWPDYLPGDVVIVRKTPDCESGDDCIVYVNGYDATLKQVKKGDDGSLSIIPRNQNYSPRTYTPEEVQSIPVSIAGVVVELRRKIRK